MAKRMVWRLETNRMQTGPWGAGACSSALGLGSHVYDPPSPDRETGELGRVWLNLYRDNLEKDFRFGFATLKAYRKWFSGRGTRQAIEAWRNALNERIVLSRYEVEDHAVIEGGWQVIFNTKYARLVEQRLPTWL